MKKFLLFGLILAALPLSANAIDGDIAGASGIQVHDMDMLREQYFRREEYNDFKEMKEEKARFWNRNKSAQEQINELKQEIKQEQQKVAAPSKRSEFVEENGQLKIKYY